jgi:hypothetical protein
MFVLHENVVNGCAIKFLRPTALTVAVTPRATRMNAHCFASGLTTILAYLSADLRKTHAHSRLKDLAMYVHTHT